MTSLVIAPHPDDEVLGCGGTIVKRIANGDKVYVCIMCEGKEPSYSKGFIEQEAKEAERANKALGVTKMINFGLPTAELDTLPQKSLNDILTKIVDGISPDEVFIPHCKDMHRDHQIVAEAAMVAVRPKTAKAPIRVLAYEVMSETDWNAPNVCNIFSPNVYVDITQTMECKLHAMKMYASQLQNSPAARSLDAVRGLAMHRGALAGVKYAEAFTLIREIER